MAQRGHQSERALLQLLILYKIILIILKLNEL
nr:MAG TPA: hypothetical protein [Crassvirales sp.]